MRAETGMGTPGSAPGGKGAANCPAFPSPASKGHLRPLGHFGSTLPDPRHCALVSAGWGGSAGGARRYRGVVTVSELRVCLMSLPRHSISLESSRSYLPPALPLTVGEPASRKSGHSHSWVERWGGPPTRCSPHRCFPRVRVPAPATLAPHCLPGAAMAESRC